MNNCYIRYFFVQALQCSWKCFTHASDPQQCIWLHFAFEHFLHSGWFDFPGVLQYMQSTFFTYTFLVFVAGVSCKLETEAAELASAAAATPPPPPPLLVSLLAQMAEVANDLKGVPVINFPKNPARCLLVDSCSRGRFPTRELPISSTDSRNSLPSISS